MTEKNHSLCVSLGSAALLALKQVKMNAATKTIYLMNKGVCQYDCSFCTQARNAKTKENMLSRVTWPVFPLKIILSALHAHADKYERICLQTVNARDFTSASLEKIVSLIKSNAPSKKLSVSLRTCDPQLIDHLFTLGVNEIGLSIDVIDPDKYRAIRGGDMQKALSFLHRVAANYPDQISVHLIIGLGETEKQTVHLLRKLRRWKCIVALFAFTPVVGSRLSDHKPPSLDSYHRIQTASYLLKISPHQKFRFNQAGKITNFGYSKAKLKDVLKKTNVFETSGCEHCNRPFYNERAGSKDLYNYPYQVTPKEFEEIFKSIFL